MTGGGHIDRYLQLSFRIAEASIGYESAYNGNTPLARTLLTGNRTYPVSN